jgi:hypothetical protein
MLRATMPDAASRRVVPWLLLAGLVALALSTWSRGIGPQSAGHAPVGTHPGAPVEFTPGRRLDAMVSIRAHALWPDRNFPPGIRPMALERAASLLRRDPDPFAPSRRRRAIATLAGYGWRAGTFPPTIAHALGTLGVDPQALLRRIDEEPAAPADGAELESRVYDAVDRDRFGGALWVADCHPTKLYQWVSPPDKPSTTSSITLSVNRSVDDIARGLDPQSWSTCNQFFLKSYLAVEPVGTADPAPDTPVAAGTAYPATAGSRLFFEHYDGRCSFGCWFKNLLDVRTWYESIPSTSDHGYHIRYDLHRYLSGTESIKIDGGGFKAEPSTGGATVTAWKTLQFQSTVATAVTAAVFRQAAAAGVITDIACCDIPSS